MRQRSAVLREGAPHRRGRAAGDSTPVTLPAAERQLAGSTLQQRGVRSRASHRGDDFGKRHRAVLAVLWPHSAERSVFSLRVWSLAVGALLSLAARVCGSWLTAVTPDTLTLLAAHPEPSWWNVGCTELSSPAPVPSPRWI